MQPIILILLAMPSLCYAHPDFAGMVYAMCSFLEILLIPLLLFLFVKNEESDRSHKAILVIRSILFFFLVVLVLFFAQIIILWESVFLEILLTLLLLFLFVKNEKSDRSLKAKLVIRSILLMLLFFLTIMLIKTVRWM
jgi:hypothetical protein